MRQALIEIPDGVMDFIRREGERHFPNECCGFLLGHSDPAAVHVAEAMPAGNEDAARGCRYAMSSRSYISCEGTARRAGMDIVGFYHSHPAASAEPSASDLVSAWPWYAYVISAVCGGRTDDVTGWRLREDRSGFEPLAIRTAMEEALA